MHKYNIAWKAKYQQIIHQETFVCSKVIFPWYQKYKNDLIMYINTKCTYINQSHYKNLCEIGYGLWLSIDLDKHIFSRQINVILRVDLTKFLIFLHWGPITSLAFGKYSVKSTYEQLGSRKIHYIINQKYSFVKSTLYLNGFTNFCRFIILFHTNTVWKITF